MKKVTSRSTSLARAHVLKRQTNQSRQKHILLNKDNNVQIKNVYRRQARFTLIGYISHQSFNIVFKQRIEFSPQNNMYQKYFVTACGIILK